MKLKTQSRIWTPSNVTQGYPYRVHQPDLIYGQGYKPIGIKGGITGALGQPVEYIADYAWKRYGGEQKVRALILKAQHDLPPYMRAKFLKWAMYNYGYNAKTLPKTYEKNISSYSFSK